MSFPFTRRALVAFSLFGSAFLTTSCGNGNNTTTNSVTPTTNQNGNASGEASGTVRVITAHGEEITNEFGRAFNEKHPNVRLTFTSRGTTDQLNYVLSRFKGKPESQGINEDIFFGGGAETFLELEKAGTLAPLSTDYKVPDELNGVPLKGKAWVGAALAGFGILANKEIAERDKLPMPKTWGDLANPIYKGRIELADPRKSGSAHTAYEIILQTNGFEKGWQILTGMSANATNFIGSSSQLMQDVAGGEAVFAPAIDFFARAEAENSEGGLVYIAPQGQNVVTPDPIGILRGAPNASAAKQFVDFVMSPEGQKLWMLNKGAQGGPKTETLYRFAALPSLYKPLSPDSSVQTDPYAGKNARPYDADKAALRRRALDDLIGAVLIDNQPALKKAWDANPDAAKVAYLPCTEAELNAFAAKWDDATAKAPIIAEWRQGAAKHYGG